MKVKVQSLDAKSGGDINLDDAIFGVEPRADILHRVVTWQLTNRRGPARAARERSEVARTGKKFGRQKGGGTARHGDRRAPIFIGGGKAHGARLRDFDQHLALLLGKALHGRNQVWNEIIPALIFILNIAPFGVHILLGRRDRVKAASGQAEGCEWRQKSETTKCGHV